MDESVVVAKGMRNVIFAGTPEFAGPALSRLINAGYNVVAVLTQPDRPAGRGQKLKPSPIKLLAKKNHIPLFQPLTLRHESQVELIRKLNPDVIIVVAYGLLIPPEILDLPPYGCLNIHASLLPRWRGAAPISRAILAGDKETGITIMQMNFGLDTGPILSQLAIPIDPVDTAGSLHDRLSDLGATMLLMTLPRLSRELIVPKMQPHAGVTFAGKIRKQEAELDWGKKAVELERAVRAFDPSPICFSQMDGQQVRVYQSKIIYETPICPPGTIVNTFKNGIDVATGEGVLRLLKIQLPGGQVLKISDVLNARASLFAVGKRFECSNSLSEER